MILHLDLFRALTQWIKQNARDALWVLWWSFDRPLSTSLQRQLREFFFSLFCVVCCLLHTLNNVDFEYFGLAHPHGKYLLFKLTLSMLVQHLIPYYAELFLASSLSHLHECGYTVLGSGCLAGSQRDTASSQLKFICCIEVSTGPHRKSDLGAPLKCFHLWSQNNLDPPVISWVSWQTFCFTYYFHSENDEHTQRSACCSCQHTHRTTTAEDHLTLDVVSQT